MTEFKPIDKTTAAVLSPYYSNCSYRNCKYSVGIKCFWYKSYKYEYCVVSGCLVVKSVCNGETVFDYPVPGPAGDIDKALDLIDSYCIENKIKPVFSYVPSECINKLTDRYNHIRFDSLRSTQDYIYEVKDLKDFNGGSYSSQRNHLNQFKKQHPDYIFRELKPDDDLSPFFDEYKKEYGQMDKAGLEEFDIAKDMASSLDCKALFGGCLETDGKIVAFSIGEITNNTIIIHIEKALYSYKGSYQVLVTEFLKHFASDSVVFVNREEDDGEYGLRMSKIQYRPCFLARKIVARASSELEELDYFPHITTKRLVLSKLSYSYNNLTFGIYNDNTLVGEVVACNPDYRGSVEINCRIFSDYRNNGFGKEAITAFSDWILYKLDLQSVKAKCNKEDVASFKILSSFMVQQDSDDTFFYFTKEV